jgi:hypothetical protein
MNRWVRWVARWSAVLMKFPASRRMPVAAQAIAAALARLRGLEGEMGLESLIFRHRGQKVGTTGFSQS